MSIHRLGWSAWLALAVAVMPGATPSSAAGQQTFVVIASGLSGEPRFAQEFADWSAKVAGAAARAGVPAANIRVLSESASGADRSTRENVLAALASVGARAASDDDLFIVLFGHGSDSGEPRLNLPGPDLTAHDLAGALQGLRVHRVVVVDAASASGAFLQPLAGPGRIVVTATKSGAEQNETTFGGYFAQALAGAGADGADGADVDKDGRVSVLEAFDFARREVERAYSSTQRLQTEHPLLDGNGDGVGSAAPTPTSEDGAPAAVAYIGGGRAVLAAATRGAGDTAAVSVKASPELKALLAEKRKLDSELADLRGRKASLPEADYQRELERLLLALSRNGQALRRLEGGAP